jgi:hypothetical protein
MAAPINPKKKERLAELVGLGPTSRRSLAVDGKNKTVLPRIKP